MAHGKTKNSKRSGAIKSTVWLIEVGFRVFAGWVLLANFDSYAPTVAAIYALGTAGAIVVAHFFKANR